MKGTKKCITYVFSRKDAKIKNHSYNSLPLEETITLHNVIIHIKSKINNNFMVQKSQCKFLVIMLII